MTGICLTRCTRETKVQAELALSPGVVSIATGIGFFDHMLTAFAFHAGISLKISASGDLNTGLHHTVEDVGIVLGQALNKALQKRSGIARFGSTILPMDDALVIVACDLSGRPYLSMAVDYPADQVAGFPVELVEEFMRAVTNNGRITLHIRKLDGRNTHHLIEAIFKAVGRAMRQCIKSEGTTTVPSTKGEL